MAVTCHLGWERGVANSRESEEKGGWRQRVRGRIKTIRDAVLRWPSQARVEDE